MIRSLAVYTFSISALTACASEPADDTLFSRLTALCGQAFEGQVTSTDPRDADFAQARLVMHVRSCESDVLRVPFHVGEDRSRTWVLTRDGRGHLELKHDHRHEDGHEDVLTQYGGTSPTADWGLSVDFPADEFSKALFEREGIPDSMANTWTMSVDESRFTYALNRPGRQFIAEFDLTQPVETPPAPWGSQD